MEAEEAGVSLWPQLPMRPSTQSQAYPLSESGSEEEHNRSQQISSAPTDKASRKIFNEERRKRKAERAAERAAKKARKEARKSAGGKDRGKEAVLVPPSSAPQQPTLSFPEVSTSPVDGDGKDDDEKDNDEKDNDEKDNDDPPTQSISTLDAPSVPTVDSAGQTESQESASTQISPSPTRLPLPKPIGNQLPKGKGEIPKLKPKARSPSTQDGSGSSELDSSIPEQADLETAIEQIAPVRPNAEAGPSTKKPKPKSKVDTPVTPRTSKKRSRESGVSQTKSPNVEDDETLRRRLTTPMAVAEFIASKYWAPPYLNRLEASGIITLKKGKLSLQETDAIKRHLNIFMRTNRLDEEQLTDIIMSKARGVSGDRESYPSFWQDLAIQIPGRPLRYVVKQIQRMYDPRARKGPWTAKEDADLKRAHEIHPGMWTKIAAIIDRTEQDCRDRWSKEIANSEKRNTGPWTLHEEDMLREAVKEANLAVGNTSLSLEAPWEIISAKLDHQRGPTQCRVKWHRELYPREKGTYTGSENPRLKPSQAKSLEAKRASQTPSQKKSKRNSKTTSNSISPRKSPMVLLKKGKGNPAAYKSQDIISDSGSDGEDEKEE